MVLTTRSISCLTLRSRCGVPMWPRKYLLTTTLVASWLQNEGTSTSVCSKTILPDSFLISALRRSHVISSYGWTPGVVQRRSNLRPSTSRPVNRPSSSIGPEAFALEPFRTAFRAGLAAMTFVPSSVVSGVTAPAARTILQPSPYRLSDRPLGWLRGARNLQMLCLGEGSVKPETTTSGGHPCFAMLGLVETLGLSWTAGGASVDRVGTARGRFLAECASA